MANDVINSVAFGVGSRYAGDYVLSGVVTVAGVPAKRRVRLFEWPTLILINEVWSNTSGIYQFSHLSERPGGGSTWGVIAVDHEGNFDPEAKVGLFAS